jgi:hypothetical protein
MRRAGGVLFVGLPLLYSRSATITGSHTPPGRAAAPAASFSGYTLRRVRSTGGRLLTLIDALQRTAAGCHRCGAGVDMGCGAPSGGRIRIETQRESGGAAGGRQRGANVPGQQGFERLDGVGGR